MKKTEPTRDGLNVRHGALTKARASGAGAGRVHSYAQGGRRIAAALVVAATAALGLTAVGQIATVGAAGATVSTCSLYWTGKVSSDWGVKGNWSATNNGSAASALPTSTSDVCMSTSPDTYTVEISTNENEAVGSFQWPIVGGNYPDLEVEGTLAIDSTSVPGTIAQFDLSGGATVTSVANITIPENGEMTLSDTSEYDNSGTLALGDGVTVSGDNTALLENEEAGTISFAGGPDTVNVEAPVTTDGTLSASGGILNLTSGSILIGPDAVATTATVGRVAGEVEISGIASPSGGASSTGSIDGLTIDGNGSLDGPGTFDIPAGDTTTFVNGYFSAGADIEVENGGTALFPPGGTMWFQQASELTNDGLVEMQTNSSTSNTNALYDNDSGSGDVVVNNADGEIEEVGTAKGQTGDVTIDLTNAGQLNGSTGTLDIENPLTLDSTSRATSSSGGEVLAEDTVQADQTAVSPYGAIDGLTFDNNTNLVGATGAGDLEVDPGQTAALAGGYIEDDGTVLNHGTLTEATNESTWFQSTGQILNYGTMTLADGSTYYDNGPSASDKIVNESTGTITYDGSNNTQTAGLNTSFVNDGTVDVPDGTLDVELTSSNLSTGGTLSGGTWDVNGTVDVDDLYNDANGVPNITSNSSTITFTANNGDTGEITADGTSMMSTLKTNSGSITTSSSFVDGTGLTNTGTFDVEAGVARASSFTQSGTSSSTTDVTGGATLKAGSTGTGPITVSGGTLEGNGGTLDGAVTDASGGTVEPTIQPDGSALQVTGTYKAASGSITEVPISGTTGAGIEFGQLAVSGAATFGGTLDVTAEDGFNATSGMSVPFVTAGSTAGFFSGISPSSAGGGLTYSVAYASTGAHLVAATTVPTVTGVSPNKIGAGASGKSVTITGTGFSSGATLETSIAGVTFSSVTVSSSTKITAKVSATTSATIGTGAVLVSESTGSGSCSGCISVDHAPTITKLSPASAAQGKTVTIKVSGKYFASGAKVTFSSSSGLTVSVKSVSSKTITISVKVSKTAKKGKRSITVTNSDGGSATKKSALDIT